MVWVCLGSSCLRLSVLSVPGYLFSSSDLGSFQPYFHQILLDPFLSSPSGTSIIWFFFFSSSCLMFHRSLKLSSLLFVFILALMTGWFPLFYLADHLHLLLYQLVCCCFLLVCFSFHLLYYSALIFFIFSSSLLKFSIYSFL